MSDPRDILKEAGVECPELTEGLEEKWNDRQSLQDWFAYDPETLDEIVLALAKLVAKYKSHVDHLFDAGYVSEEYITRADLDDEWENR
jgi:hypothetical protein